MSYLSPIEVARVWNMRPDVLATLTRHMALFELRTGRKTTVPRDGGVRTAARQAEIHADSLAVGGGFKPEHRAAAAGSSAHEYGAAYDLHIVGASGFSDPLYETLARIGEELGLVAGLHFKSGPPDPFHFETKETNDVRRRQWAALVGRRLRRNLLAGALVIGAGVAAYRLWRTFTRRRHAR